MVTVKETMGQKKYKKYKKILKSTKGFQKKISWSKSFGYEATENSVKWYSDYFEFIRWFSTSNCVRTA